jgi:hypothetical protein
MLIIDVIEQSDACILTEIASGISENRSVCERIQTGHLPLSVTML